MFGRRVTWDDYVNDILAFTSALGTEQWTPSRGAREFLLAAQRGYRRVGLAGVEDGWRAMAAVCLWRACCAPENLQLVMAGTMKSGHAWIRYLKQIAAESTDMIRKHLLFTEDESMILVVGSDDPVVSVLSPGHLIGAARVTHGRPTTLVMPDLDRVPTKWFPVLNRFTDGPLDQWLVVAPVR